MYINFKHLIDKTINNNKNFNRVSHSKQSSDHSRLHASSMKLMLPTFLVF